MHICISYNYLQLYGHRLKQNPCCRIFVVLSIPFYALGTRISSIHFFFIEIVNEFH